MTAPSGHTAVYAVVGHPVRHSLSPALHNHAFAVHGIDAVYVALEVAPTDAAGLMTALRTVGLAGANLTVPFKEAVLGGLDEVGPMAARLGAVNTVVRRDDRWLGFNTDAAGFVAGLREELGVDPEGARCVVLGAGGAGLAVGAGLAEAGAASMTWCNRTVSRAEAAVDRCAGAWPDTTWGVTGFAPDAVHAVLADADLVVQATSGPGADAVRALDAERVPAHAVWSDLNYWMGDPPLADALRARGVRVQDGRAMLAHQAALAFEHFTGILPDGADLRARIG